MPLKKKSKLPPAKFHEDNSVLLRRIGNVELRLTQTNRLFAMRGRVIAWPYLNGEAVRFDVSGFEVSRPVIERIRTCLKKQQEIRKQHALDWDEDEDAVFKFN